MDAIHTLTLNAQEHSKIGNLSLYPHQAQLTRIFRISVAAGQNSVRLFSLPNVVDHDSVRVEVRGPVIIQGVSSSKVELQEPEQMSSVLEMLQDKRQKAGNTLVRCRKALAAIDTYIGKLDVEHLDISKLGEAMEVYEATEEKWDTKISETEKEIIKLDRQIADEETRLARAISNKKLRTEVMVKLFGQESAGVELHVTYAVSHASWTASYDVRVNMQLPEQPVRVTYKANITQETGEVWDNAPITLETSQPIFGVELPSLGLWNITHTKSGLGLGRGGAKRHRKYIPDVDDMDFEEHETAEVTSKGHVVATFRVPGETTVPSDDNQHSVTIAELDLEAVLSWLCIPKCDTRVHLKANIINSSEYTFLPGTSHIYVDKSFICRSEIPNVSPGEMFTCPLGIDPSIRVIYHPQTRMLSQSGFYNKSEKHSFSQQITIHNTKPVGINGVKITDNIPVSQDANISVNLINPALARPASSSLGKPSGPPEVLVTEGVVARWSGSEDPDIDPSIVDQPGKVSWICKIPPQGKVNILLQWDVQTTRQKAEIYGLF